MCQRAAAARDRAVHLLTHYITVVADKAGVKLDPGDTRAELGEAVDAILEAAARQAPVSEHAQAVQAYRDGERGNLGRLHDGETVAADIATDAARERDRFGG